jgi:hypothetical protein
VGIIKLISLSECQCKRYPGKKNDAIPVIDVKEKLFKEAGERRAYRQRPRVEPLPVLNVIERFWALSRSAIEC